MKQFAVIAFIALGLAQQAQAQTFLDELKENKQGQGTVTVTQSPEIDELVNNTKLVRTQPTTPKQTTTTNHPKPTADAPTPKPNNTPTASKPATETATPEKSIKPEKTQSASTHTETATDPATADTSKKVMRNAKRVTGYRVQAFSGGNSGADKRKAESIGNAIKARFPDLPVYVHFYSPRWICRVGNFRTYQEANEVLNDIKNMGYPQACIVKGKISIAY